MMTRLKPGSIKILFMISSWLRSRTLIYLMTVSSKRWLIQHNKTYLQQEHNILDYSVKVKLGITSVSLSHSWDAINASYLHLQLNIIRVAASSTQYNLANFSDRLEKVITTEEDWRSKKHAATLRTIIEKWDPMLYLWDYPQLIWYRQLGVEASSEYLLVVPHLWMC